MTVAERIDPLEETAEWLSDVIATYFYAHVTVFKKLISPGTVPPPPPHASLQSTHDLLVPVEPVSSWCPISLSQYNSGGGVTPT
jgi:hypothetical protein